MKFLGVISGLNAYKRDTTVDVTGKDGITRPITKVYYVKPCFECGVDMEIDTFKAGKVVKTKFGPITKGRVIRWKCTSCDYSEREETQREELIREGLV